MRGFTILELVIVISITSIIALSAYPLLQSDGQMSLDTAARVVKTDILFTQQLAMSEGQSRSVTFVSGQSWYQYGYGVSGPEPQRRDLAQMDGSLVVGSDITVTFNSLGEPSPMTTDTSIAILGRDKSISVSVTAYTGKTAIRDL